MRSRQRKPRWRRVLDFLTVLWVGYLLVCVGLAKLYISPPRTDPPKLLSFKRTTLPNGEPVWVSPSLSAGKPRGHTLFVMAHGYGGSVGHWSYLGKKLYQKGFEILLAEMPAHGDSPDPSSGFGPHEAKVLNAATEWARGRYSKPPRVVLVGVSLGGSASWLASAERPDLYNAIITEGAFARLDETVDRWFGSRLPGGQYVLRPVKWLAASMAGVNASAVNPVEAAEKWKGKPALVIHCEKDALMDKSNAERLAKASGADIWVVPNAEHAQGSGVAPEEYLHRLLAIGATASAGHQN